MKMNFMNKKMNFKIQWRKAILFFSIFMLNAFSVFSQKDTLFINDIYTNPSNYLVLEKIIKVDSTSMQELMNRFENWAGANFRDYSNVRTSKTEDQITLLYITDAVGIKMYVILKAEFKDNKAKVSFYDDGNVATPGSYVGSTYHPGISGRTFRMTSYFENDKLIYKVNGGAFNLNTNKAKNALSFKKTIDNTSNEIETNLKNKSVQKEKSDW